MIIFGNNVAGKFIEKKLNFDGEISSLLPIVMFTREQFMQTSCLFKFIESLLKHEFVDVLHGGTLSACFCNYFR